jgi:hypothetical protein
MHQFLLDQFGTSTTYLEVCFLYRINPSIKQEAQILSHQNSLHYHVQNSRFFCWCGYFGNFIKIYKFTLQCTVEWGYLRVFWSFYFMILNLNCEIYDSGCNFWGNKHFCVQLWEINIKTNCLCRHARRAMPTRFYPLPNRAYPCHLCHLCRCYHVPFCAVPPVPFRAVFNALIMPCRAVPNFLKAGHDTVKTRIRNSTVPVPVPCLNPFHFQPCSFRSVPFPATACLNLEH